MHLLFSLYICTIIYFSSPPSRPSSPRGPPHRPTSFPSFRVRREKKSFFLNFFAWSEKKGNFDFNPGVGGLGEGRMRAKIFFFFQTRGSAQGRDGRGKGGGEDSFLWPMKEKRKNFFFLVTVVSFPFLRYKNNPVSWCVWGRGASRHRKSDKANRARASVFAGIFFFSLLSSSSSYQSHYKFGTIPNLTHRFFFITVLFLKGMIK